MNDLRSTDPLVGREIAGYRLLARIGEGAMGAVYRARSGDLDRPVAVKILHDDLGAIHGLRRRFEREARALAKMDHPRIVSVADFGMVDGITFLAMELLEGDTLEELLEDHAIDPRRGLAIMGQVLEALAYAHAREVVHRDLKPANVFLSRAGDGSDSVKVLDFGFVKFLSIDDLSQEATLTRRGRIVGTPAYMAPEQITGLALDVRADVYAAGVLLYELLTDRRPFVYERRSELLRAHLTEPPPPLESARRGLWVAPALEALVQRALAKDPNARFASAEEMGRALARLPAEPARLDLSFRAGTRTRKAPASSVMSVEELAAAASALTSTASASGGVSAQGSTSSETAPFLYVPEAVRETWRPPPAPAARRRRDPVTVGAWVIALLLAGVAAGLWITVGP